jgi:hypothetical protein
MRDVLREAIRQPGCWSTAFFVLAAAVAAIIVASR